MQDIHSRIAGLRRPRLLVRAARFGVDGYDRAQRLPRLLERDVAPGTGEALVLLLELEEEHDLLRRTGRADYSAPRHVDVLIAIMAESRALRHMRPGAVAPEPAGLN